jgi:hypothetical protein
LSTEEITLPNMHAALTTSKHEGYLPTVQNVCETDQLPTQTKDAHEYIYHFLCG